MRAGSKLEQRHRLKHFLLCSSCMCHQPRRSTQSDMRKFSYIAQLGISSAVVHRQRKSYFRKSDLLQPWREQSDEEASEVASEPTLVASASRSTTPSKFSPSSIPSRSTTTTKHSSSSFPWILEAEVPFLAAPAFAHHAKLIPSRVIGSLEGLGHRSH